MAISDFCQSWCYGSNSNFLISEPHDHDSLKVYTPDGVIADEDNRILVVVEVANSQSMRSVLMKTQHVWLRVPDVLGAVIIKIAEAKPYHRPDSTKTPVEEFVTMEDWMRREWPPGKITYDDHTWIDQVFFRFIIAVKRRLNVPEPSDVEVCFSFVATYIFDLPKVGFRFTSNLFMNQVLIRNPTNVQGTLTRQTSKMGDNLGMRRLRAIAARQNWGVPGSLSPIPRTISTNTMTSSLSSASLRKGPGILLPP
jgi:hypothetical protein